MSCCFKLSGVCSRCALTKQQMNPCVWHTRQHISMLAPALQQDPNATSSGSYPHDVTWNSLFHHHPMHHHHNSYKFLLSKQQRQRGISHYGSAERLRAALSRAITSKCRICTLLEPDKRAVTGERCICIGCHDTDLHSSSVWCPGNNAWAWGTLLCMLKTGKHR